MGIEQQHFIITGCVQGVGYRYSARNYALNINLVGWVKNHDNGSVEMLAEGDKIILEQLLKWAEQGPHFAKVDKVEVHSFPASGEFIDFTIR